MMALNAGDLRYRVEFLTGMGAPIQNPNPQFWASITTVKSERMYEAFTAYAKTTYEVRMRYCTLIDPQFGISTIPRSGWQIRVYMGNGTFRDFQIETCVDVDMRHEELRMVISEVA